MEKIKLYNLFADIRPRDRATLPLINYLNLTEITPVIFTHKLLELYYDKTRGIYVINRAFIGGREDDSGILVF